MGGRDPQQLLQLKEVRVSWSAPFLEARKFATEGAIGVTLGLPKSGRIGGEGSNPCSTTTTGRLGVVVEQGLNPPPPHSPRVG